MADDSFTLLEWSISKDGDRALLTVQFDERNHVELWSSAKKACQQLLGFGKVFTACSAEDSRSAIATFPQRLRAGFEYEISTLYEVDVEDIGNISAVGKAFNRRHREQAGAIAMIVSAWLVDKAKQTGVFRTVGKEPA